MIEQADKLILHGYFRSSAAYRVRIALNLKGLFYNSIPHHLRKGEQRAAAYQQLNPQGLVPTLKQDDFVLTQSLAIIEYLDECYPLPALLPQDSRERARVRSIAQIVACDIHPINNLRVLNYLRETLSQPEEAVQTWYRHWITQGFDALEQELRTSAQTGLFCHGNTPSLADICLVPQVANARNFNVDLGSYPTIQRIAAETVSIPAFQKALPANQPDAE